MPSNQNTYAAPIITKTRQVPPGWIDYNGHMNVSYYGMAFDQAIDEVFEDVLQIGVSHTKTTRQGPYVVQNHVHYLGELLEGASFSIRFHLIDHDPKRLHLFLEMRDDQGNIAATSEQLLMNVDLKTRRPTPYPAWVLAQLALLQSSHDTLPKPSQLGAALGIRRKG